MWCGRWSHAQAFILITTNLNAWWEYFVWIFKKKVMHWRCSPVYTLNWTNLKTFCNVFCNSVLWSNTLYLWNKEDLSFYIHLSTESCRGASFHIYMQRIWLLKVFCQFLSSDYSTCSPKPITTKSEKTAPKGTMSNLCFNEEKTKPRRLLKQWGRTLQHQWLSQMNLCHLLWWNHKLHQIPSGQIC